ncbi:MAG: hypothetical protein OEZ68_14180 [Gammaproteobacteria bacterium]|nr:hypothetical protein [Gammaproteobacteria bacterium]MDH5801951.1 hypothetical protein [Gammaproteobacteria bacterium]
MTIRQTASTFLNPTLVRENSVSAQLQALSSVTPKSDVEATAKTSQTSLLTDFNTVEKRQIGVNTAFSVQSAATTAQTLTTALQQQSIQEDQVKSLTTTNNRDKLVNAVKYGVDSWRLQAHFANIQIMGQTAIGVPGCLQGPDLKPWITQAPGIYNSSGMFKTLANAVADAVSASFKQWQDTVTVPGLPWYPMFVAVAAPFAPPTPNIPMPLIVCVSQNFSKLASPSTLESAIYAKLPAEFKIAEMNLFIYNLAVHLMNYFVSWMSSQNVMMVMGMGPVPTFNPPYVPVGSVLNGYVIPSPGHLAS